MSAPPAPTSRIALLALSGSPATVAGDDWGDATPEEADGYDPELCHLPAGIVAELSAASPASPALLALNCGIGPGGFLPGNQCARGGYGRDAGLRTSRVTRRNITAAGATKGREFADSAGRKVTEHTTADGRTFHEVVHPSGRKSFHQIQGPAKARAATAAARPAKAAGDKAAGGGTGSLANATAAEFGKAVQKLADEHGTGFGDNKVFIHDVYAKAKALDPSLTEASFKNKLKAAAAAGAVELGRADMTALFHPDDLKASYVNRTPGADAAATGADGYPALASANFVIAKAADRAQVRGPGGPPAAAAPAGQFARYRMPDGSEVRVGNSGRIVAGDAKNAGHVGRKPADAGAVPEADYHAGKPAGSKPAAGVAAREPRAATAPADEYHRRQQFKSRQALARAASRMGERPPAAKPSPAAAGAAYRDAVAKAGERDAARNSAKSVQAGDRVTLPEYKGSGGVNYGTVRDAEVVKVTDKFVTVRIQNDPGMAAMFGSHSQVKIPRSHLEAVGTVKRRGLVASAPAASDEPALPKISGVSDKQAAYATSVRADRVADAGRLERQAGDAPGHGGTEDREAATALKGLAAARTDARFWLDTRVLSTTDMAHAAAGRFPEDMKEHLPEQRLAFREVARAAGKEKEFRKALFGG